MDVDSSEVLGAVVALFQPSVKAPAARQRCLKAVSEHFGSPAAVASDDTWCGVTKEGFAGTISQSVEECKVENVLIMPPAKEIGEKVLAAKQFNNSKQEELIKMWHALHACRRHEDAPPVRDQLRELRGAYVSRCMRAGQCLCGAHVSKTRRFIDAVRSKLRVWFRKKGFGRRTYELQLAVLKLSSEHEILWLYVGFGNLQDNCFTVIELGPVSGSPQHAAVSNVSIDGGHVFVASGSPGCLSVLKKLHIDKEWHMQLFQLAVSSTVPMPVFLPIAAVVPVHPEVAETIWRCLCLCYRKQNQTKQSKTTCWINRINMIKESMKGLLLLAKLAARLVVVGCRLLCLYGMLLLMS